MAGIDWASQTHVCCVIDDTDGRVLERFDVSHDAAALRAMPKRLGRAGCRVWRSSVVTVRWSRC